MNAKTIQDIYPLSPMQQGMLFHSLSDPRSGAYCVQTSWTFEGDLDVSALRQAWQHAVDRHPILRTDFDWEELDEPVQVVYRHVTLPFEQMDWRHLPKEQQDQQLEQYLAQDRSRGFDLGQAPLMRLALIRLGDETYRFIWSNHHLLLDGWSAPLLLKEVFQDYQALRSGPVFEPPRTRPYRDYIVWLQQQDKTKAEAFWRRRLAGFEAPTSLRLANPDPNRTGYGNQQLRLTAATTDRLTQLARQNEITLNTVVQGAWSILLHRYSGDRDILFGVTVSGRPADLDGVESMVGNFINTLPLRVAVEQDRLVPWLKRLQAQQLELQQYEYSRLFEVQGLSKIGAGQPLFESLFVFENYPVQPGQTTGGGGKKNPLKVHGIQTGEQTNYPLTVVAKPGQQLGLQLLYQRGRFDDVAIERLLAHFKVLLEAIASEPQVNIDDLPILTNDERHQLLVAWNQTSVERPSDRCVHQLFEQHAEEQPDAVAVSDPKQQLTYGQLNKKANQLARHLKSLGVSSETIVGVLMERSCDLVVALLAILKAGGAYTPMDPAYPSKRLAFMLSDTQAPVLLTQENLLGLVQADASAVSATPPSGPIIFCLDRDFGLLADARGENLPSAVSPNHLAYVVYTSGSTGTPKGVAVEHAGLLNLVGWHNQAYRVTPQDRATLIAGVAFDASVWELWPYLAAGASLHVPDDVTRAQPQRLVDWFAQQQISISFLPTPLAEAVLNDVKWPKERALTTMLTGGDKLHRAPQYELGFQLINHYGPTENTVVATCGQVAVGYPGAPSIGRPIANTQVYLLDRQLRPVPIGVPGELYIGGKSLARGYLNHQALTDERFVPNPFDEDASCRLYRTGDLVRYLADGQIEFLGRIDNQVKIRGYRIELGEIEAVLAQHPIVREAAVAAHQDTSGDKRLIAYIVPQAEAALDEVAIKAWLQQQLPDHMIPSVFVRLDALPLTPNGKLDRHALVAPDSQHGAASDAYVAPRDPVEEMVAVLWANVLGGKRVGIHDNFFDLGGHSLLATRLVSVIRDALKIEIPLTVLFDYPTVAQLTAWLGTTRGPDQRPPLPPVQPVSREDNLPLSMAQQRMWFLSRFDSNQSHYHIFSAVRLAGELDVPAMKRSLGELVRRHESLRTSFPMIDSQPIQQIHPPGNFQVKTFDLRDKPQDQRQRESQQLIANESQSSFDLATGPLFRAVLIQLADDQHVLTLTMHHIISDGWSVGVLTRELAQLYTAFSSGQVSPLPELRIQYADYACWQQQWFQGDAMASQLTFWKQQLADLPTLELATDRSRRAVQTYHGATQTIVLPSDLTEPLRQLSRELGATLYMTMLAAFEALLGRYSGQDDIVIGTPIAGRNHSDIEQLVGFFVNTLVLRTDLSGNPTFEQLVERVKQTALNAFANQDLPFDKLVEALAPERDLSRNPLFQVAFAILSATGDPIQLPGLTLLSEPSRNTTTRFDLELHVVEQPDKLYAVCTYSTDLFDAATIDRLLTHYGVLLEAITENPKQHLAELPLIDSAEQDRLLTQLNQTQSQYPRDVCIHDLFVQQAAQTPHAVALIEGDQQLTYEQLNTRANQLAHELQAVGVGPDQLVGLCLERSVDMVVGLLAILKAGGAYLPLDPNYPADRLAYMLQDAKVQVLVTQQAMLTQLPDAGQLHHRPKTICLDDPVFQQAIGAASLDTPVSRANPDHLAYVTYTSGSTGVPKGVQVRHRGVARLLFGVDYVQLDADQVILQLAPISFDASTFEIFGALLHGGQLVLYPKPMPTPAELGQVLTQHHVTTLWLTASLYNAVIDQHPQALASVAQLLIGGEALSVAHVRRGLEQLPNTTIINGYGPTEGTTFTCCYPIPRPLAENLGSIPIGRPIGNTQVYVVDRHMNPVPVGVPGELLIGGDGLARGYLHDEALTAQKFIDHPFATGKLYRTGDRVRYLADGTVEFLGRLDDQVKVRGFRIELGEIEAALAKHPAVRQAVVMCRKDPHGDKCLVAYTVLSEAVDTHALKSFLKQHLPDYMVPSAMVILDAMPVTPNGKVDRDALPPPVTDQLQATYIAPSNNLEQTIASVWQDVLGLDRVGTDDNFFDLGGHSLLLAQVHDKLNGMLENEVTIIDLFRYPTIRALAVHIQPSASGVPQKLAQPDRQQQDAAGRQRLKQRLTQRRTTPKR